MKSRICVFTHVVILGILVTVGLVGAQKRMTPDEIVAALKPGQWVKVAGTPQSDSSIICEEIKILIGDFLDDDWSLRGVVQEIDLENRQLEILGLPIKIAEDAEFEGKNGDDAGIADLKAGMLLEVNGTYLKNGFFLSNEIEDKSAKLKKAPALVNDIKAEGKVEQVEAANHRFTLMGITFQITEKTRSRSVIE
jgi:hypothetical protein